VTFAGTGQVTQFWFPANEEKASNKMTEISNGNISRRIYPNGYNNRP
jgi:hypothetical protein